jgi:hypothetical protein
VRRLGCYGETVAASHAYPSGAHRALGRILRVTTHAAARWLPALYNGRGAVPLHGDSKVTGERIYLYRDIPVRAVSAQVRPRGATRRFEQRSSLHHLQVRAEATVRSICTGLQTAWLRCRTSIRVRNAEFMIFRRQSSVLAALRVTQRPCDVYHAQSRGGSSAKASVPATVDIKTTIDSESTTWKSIYGLAGRPALHPHL